MKQLYLLEFAGLFSLFYYYLVFCLPHLLFDSSVLGNIADQWRSGQLLNTKLSLR